MEDRETPEPLLI